MNDGRTHFWKWDPFWVLTICKGNDTHFLLRALQMKIINLYQNDVFINFVLNLIYTENNRIQKNEIRNSTFLNKLNSRYARSSTQHMHLKFHLFCIFPDFPEKKKIVFHEKYRS